ncbi:MAG: hypothetical protein WBF58_15695 [Xanthobacteraceae bacterium]
MDFGLARFLEMFEERFGRRATTALLAVIGLAVFGYCVRLILETTIYFYGDITSALHVTDTSITALVLRILTIIMELFIIWIFGAAIVRFYFRPKIEKLRDHELKRIEDMQSKLDAQFDKVESAIESAKKYAQEADEKTAQLRQLGVEQQDDADRRPD